jgi:DNA-binding MarR family transcriptional regulator
MSQSSAAALARVLSKIRELDPEMPAQSILALLLIASKDNYTQQDLRDDMGIVSSTSARIAARLGEWEKFPNQPGLGLVNNETNPADRRTRILSLTARGKAFVASLLKELE